MYIHDIIPIQKGIPFDVLSYYHPTELPIGTVVIIKIGSVSRFGIVFGARSLLEEKASVRTASFTLKKITAVVCHYPILEDMVRALTEVGNMTLAPLGAVLSSCLSERHLEHILKMVQKEMPEPALVTRGQKQKAKSGKKDIAVIIGETKDRIASYKEHIREYLALDQSIIVVVPTILDAESLYNSVSKGIEKRVFCLHSKKKVREYTETITKATTSKDPVVLIATVPFSFLLRNDIGLFIIAKESSEFYESSDRFHVDTRLYIKKIAEKMKAAIVYADLLPRFEHFALSDRERFPVLPFMQKIDVVTPTGDKKSIFPKEIVELLQFAREKNRTLFFYSHRRGLAPVSRCKDCGTVVLCPHCKLPLVLKKDKLNEHGVPLYVCNTCGYTTSSHYTCTVCRSWNIVALEIGTESIVNEIKRILGSDTRILTLEDGFKNFTEAERNKIASPGTIYVGTEHFFPYLPAVDYTILPFFDRVLSTPSYETMERALRVLLYANEWSSRKAIVFSNGAHSLFQHLQKGTIERFIAEELQLRKQFQFPPYGVFLRITVFAPAGSIQKIIESFEEIFREENITPISLGARRVNLAGNTIQKSWILLTNDTWIRDEGPDFAQRLLLVRSNVIFERNPHYFS